MQDGVEPSGYAGAGTSGPIPFMDTDYFEFACGDTSAGERFIDSQYASSNLYVGHGAYLFGVNFADGRIKGYGLTLFGRDKTFMVACVRANSTYGVNAFSDNEAGQTDYSFYWSGTTHANWTDTPGSAGAYVSFGRAMGYVDSTWQDVHGAGA